MIVGWGLLIVGHWAHKQPTLSVNQVVEMVAAILIISFLDQGQAEPVAKGLAWLFLAAVLLSSNSPLSALSASGGLKTTTTKAA
jgi:hypothetical protein